MILGWLKTSALGGTVAALSDGWFAAKLCGAMAEPASINKDMIPTFRSLLSLFTVMPLVMIWLLLLAIKSQDNEKTIKLS